MTERLAVLDHQGDLLAYIHPGPANRAVARREIVRTDNPRVFRLRPDALDRFKVQRDLTPEERRRRHLAKASKR